MGLGKTIQVLSLILADSLQPPIFYPTEQCNTAPLPQSQQPARTHINWGKTTLIVCPLSVVGNWTTQIEVSIFSLKLTTTTTKINEKKRLMLNLVVFHYMFSMVKIEIQIQLF